MARFEYFATREQVPDPPLFKPQLELQWPEKTRNELVRSGG